MALRFSLRTLCRDTAMLLLGAFVISLARGYLRPCQDYASLCLVKREETATGANRGDLVSHNAGRSVGAPSRGASTAFQKMPSQLPPASRPKTLAAELAGSMRKPLFVGVVTAQSLLSTRAMAVNQTWGGKVPHLAFFSSTGSSNHGLPVVSLPDVDDTYPPQKKVYRMLKYMHDNFIDEYNWFMRADDDIYVRVEPLLYFLSKLDPSKELYIGQPGSGRAEDLQRIDLLPHEHFCMGGPGVIFSRALLRRLAPHLEDCLQNVVVSWNEDVEVGRCISRKLGVQCTWNYEMRKLFFMDYTKGEIFRSPAVYQNRNLREALTVHSFKDPDMMLRIHQYYLELALDTAEARVMTLKNELAKASHVTGRTSAFP